ncbi:DUF6891 domain-containing protein [Qipengyuania vesicularis]|uniref:DUF6891 domain-containing protein n=1 Tax=Qipengyuania vesicularis TaxID=2867232 RepID=UPI001C88993C|nr:hypothetical protein [Qipengyuania vesicularis]MBX7528022.1 hypothetical protein [Qipengyuania vesicularis]
MSSIWNWLFGGSDREEGTPRIDAPGPFVREGEEKASPGPVAPELADEIRGHLRREIAAGYEDEDYIIDGAVDIFLDEHEDEAALRALALNLWPDLVAEHRALQADWPEVTDYDRLHAAFTALEAKGIVSREHFTCCSTCGSAEIWDEIEAVTEAGGAARGYTFFHWQDTESAVEGGGVYLSYGACEEGEGPALGIAREIVAELKAHDLPTDWNGSWGMKIGVPLDWKRRSAYAA